VVSSEETVESLKFKAAVLRSNDAGGLRIFFKLNTADPGPYVPYWRRCMDVRGALKGVKHPHCGTVVTMFEAKLQN
jgi:hypothetical protein